MTITAQRISDTIEDGSITITELAKAIGITRQQVTRWKDGTSDPTATNLQKFCEIYQVSADYILGLPQGLSWPRN